MIEFLKEEMKNPFNEIVDNVNRFNSQTKC